MNRAIIYAVIGTLVVMGVVFGAGPIQRRFRELRSDQALISGDTGDVMASATYQRFQARREAIIAMREDLRRLVSAESAFIADSGRPTTVLLPPYGFAAARGNLGPTIQIKPDRWIGTMTSNSTTMMCQVTSLYDTIRMRYGPGQIDCLGESAVDSAWAVAQREAAAEPPPPPPLAPEPVPEPDTMPAVPRPRPHRNWGPVNNKPPPMPWIVENECPGEYCSLGRWAACSTITAFPGKQRSRPAFELHSGEEFTALKGDLHVEVPGLVVFRDTVSNPPIEHEGDDSIQFTPVDTLYLLDDMSEGYLHWWYRGRAAVGYQFWYDRPDKDLAPHPAAPVALIRRTKSVWWVRVRNARGREGWVEYDWRKMARDDRMDELSRCLPTTKG